MRAARLSGAATLRAAAATLPKTVTPGVVTGQAYKDLLTYAKEKGFAMPGAIPVTNAFREEAFPANAPHTTGVNIVGSNSINSCLEAARKYGGPMIITFSKGGGQFIAGKSVDNTDDKASIAG